MGCSRRAKYADIRPEQKWDFISLNDFKSTSCFEPFAYGYLWVSLVISVAVYGVDTFTAVNLLAFDKWAGEIKPKVPINISKWIFSGCIILSWLNLGYEYLRAGRVMKRGAVAESYLDSLAVRIQSIRMGDGRGWRRFLVFAELTKSKKGAEYVALFTYFSFQSWVRVIFCQGPRQVVNALTLYSVYVAQLDPKQKDVGSSLLNFFKNIGILAGKQHQAAVILSGMLFTLVIWVFAAISLILALLFYLLFLWHYIPNSDGGLTGYCERKINGRLTRIVSAKVNKALEEEERKKLKAAQRAAKKGEKPVMGRQATLPTLFAEKSDDKLPNMPMVNRNDTMTTLPMYTSRPGTPGSQNPTIPAFELSNLDSKRPGTARTDTESSAVSYGSSAPLMGAASEMGYGRAGSPASSTMDSNGFPFPQRSMTGNSSVGQWQRDGPQPNRGPPSRQMTQDSFNSPLGPSRQMTPGYPADPVGRQMTPGYPPDPVGRQMTPGYPPDPVGRQMTPGYPLDPVGRQMTPGYPPDTVGRHMTPDSQRGPPSRQMTNDSFNSRGPPSRQMTQDNFATSPTGYSNSFGGADPRPQLNNDNYGRPIRRPVGDVNGRNTPDGRNSPAPSVRGPAYPPQRGNSTMSPLNANSDVSSASDNNSNFSNSSYGGNPNQRSASAGIPGPGQPPPQRLYRNMTEPVPQQSSGNGSGEYFGNQLPRQNTLHERVGSGGSYDPYRSASPASFNGRLGPGPQQQGPSGGYRR